ncbi:MAG: co-chaperone GroES, partial [bacterium]
MADPKLIPIGDRVVVKPEPAEEKTQSGIVLPDITKEKPQEGTIIGVGTGRVLDNGQKIPVEVKVG